MATRTISQLNYFQNASYKIRQNINKNNLVTEINKKHMNNKWTEQERP